MIGCSDMNRGSSIFERNSPGSIDLIRGDVEDFVM